MTKALEIVVYGAETPCPSCMNSPSSRDTKEWLEAAIQRKYPDQPIHFRYVDINEPVTEEDHEYVEKIWQEEYFYPLVVASNQIIGEGNPKLKTIFQFLDQLGFQSN